MSWEDYDHEPLTVMDGWRALYHARCYLIETNQGHHPLDAFELLWDTQDALLQPQRFNQERFEDKWRHSQLNQAQSQGS